MREMIDQGNEQALGRAVRDTTSDLSIAIQRATGGIDMANHTAVARLELLKVAARTDREIAAILATTMATELDHALSAGNAGIVNIVITRMCTKFDQDMTHDDSAENPIWPATIEILV